MAKMVENIKIKNFKSISDCTIDNCKRINLFIGRPNVGKSNILEALSLFSLPYLRENTSKKLDNLVRVENESELFFNGDLEKDCLIHTNLAECDIKYSPKTGLSLSIDYLTDAYTFQVDDKLNVRFAGMGAIESPIKKYIFHPEITYRKSHAKYLIPPYGFNLLNILENYDQLKQETIDLFKETGLEIAFDKASRTIKVIQAKEKGIFLIPYNSIADTLQRIIFYKAAITSNNDSVLLFEEPEAHSFPPYMTQITQEMIAKKDNQFFIATHSPFILNDLIEHSRSELAVFVVYYENRQTKIRYLSDDTLHEIFQYGVDIFTNSESFI